MTYRSSSVHRGATATAVVVILLLVVGLVAYMVEDNTTRSRTTTICLLERTATDGGGEYRVYTADTGTYAIKDSFWGKRRSNSADFYAKLKAQTPGTFRIEYDHHRVGWQSWFPNLLSATKLEPNQTQLARCGPQQS